MAPRWRCLRQCVTSRRILTMHAYSAPNWLAMHLRRHMYLYGTTREQIGWLAINSRRNAALNPNAAYRDPITHGGLPLRPNDLGATRPPGL